MFTRLRGSGWTSGATENDSPTGWPGVGYGSWPTSSTFTSASGRLNARRMWSPCGRYPCPLRISSRRNRPIAVIRSSTGSSAAAQSGATRPLATKPSNALTLSPTPSFSDIGSSTVTYRSLFDSVVGEKARGHEGNCRRAGRPGELVATQRREHPVGDRAHARSEGVVRQRPLPVGHLAVHPRLRGADVVTAGQRVGVDEPRVGAPSRSLQRLVERQSDPATLRVVAGGQRQPRTRAAVRNQS